MALDSLKSILGCFGICFRWEVRWYSFRKIDCIPRLANCSYPTVCYCLSLQAKIKGVSILIAHSIPWTFISQHTDEQGRFLFVKGKIGEVRMTCSNICFPDHLAFICRLSQVIIEFGEGLMILGWFKFHFDPLLDVSRGSTHVSCAWTPLSALCGYLAIPTPVGSWLHILTFQSFIKLTLDLITFLFATKILLMCLQPLLTQ